MTEGASIEESYQLSVPCLRRAKAVVAEDEEEEEDEEEDEEEVPYVAVVPRTNSSSNRHSIFVDEDAQAMDALPRARHRQSLRLQKGEDGFGDDDEDYEMNGIALPEK
ncbi:hypothetical protein BGZ58_001532 [Dissophora ornata]|nr:hypothetical protein BGZ58_001532 [Dissophora ornata]